MHQRIPNTRGGVAIAHWDVPDNGNSEFFINLKTNSHLDQAYGGYCVFAEVVGATAGMTGQPQLEVEDYGDVSAAEVLRFRL